MRVIVCGGRHYDDRDHIHNTLTRIDAERGPIDVIIHGAATGADNEAMLWTQMMDGVNGRSVKHLPFPADWHSFGGAAGAIRNRRMLIDGWPNFVIAFPGGRGTEDMVKRATVRGVEVMRIPPRERINGNG